MPFDQFPPVDGCCFFVRNLKFATFLISVFSMFRGLDIAVLALVPYCRNFFAVHGFYMALFAALTAGFGVLVCISSIIMAFNLIVYSKPMVDFYIVSVFLSVGASILFFCIAGMRTLMGEFECDGRLDVNEIDSNNKSVYNDQIFWTRTGAVLYMFVDYTIVGMAMIYFALVANQYALEVLHRNRRPGDDF